MRAIRKHQALSGKLKIAILLVLIYLASLFTGMLTILGYSMVQRHNSRPASFAEQITDAFFSDDLQSLVDEQWTNLGIVIYGTSGARLLTIDPSNPIDGLDITQPTERYVSGVLSGTAQYKLAVLFQSGSLIPVILTVDGVPITQQDTVVGAAFIINVVSEMTDAILSFFCFYTILYWIASICITVSFDRARRTNQMRRIYIANITHALKAPIASVKSITETLSDVQTLDDDRKMSYYGMILSEMNVLNHLVFQMLELSRLQSGEHHFVRQTLSFEEIFGSAVEKYKVICECTQVTFDLSPELYQLPVLNTDPSAAEMVLEILLENAVKYTRPGNTIRISASVSKRHVTFCVWDNGGSIAEQDIPHVFDRFYKGKNSDFSSSGLGLAIAKETTCNLREKLWVKCIQPNETMFFFTIATV